MVHGENWGELKNEPIIQTGQLPLDQLECVDEIPVLPALLMFHEGKEIWMCGNTSCFETLAANF